jgi:hypothetical protein
MNRRDAVKNIIIATGSLITLPAWMGCGNGDTVITHLSSFSAAEQKLLAGITDTIIPVGNSIGALSMEVDKFLQKIIDDCYEKEVQDNVKTQLQALETSAKTINGKSYTECSHEQRQDLLLKFSVSAKKEEKDFFSLMRNETIRGFNTSQKVMSEFLSYKIAPGHYYGCVDIKA